ncbi:hypothetical protein SUGI_0638650 [Cryptomeria japonica]|uniref:uncharacterized protein LOC131052869 n=1 Tax=Cryptomeria japonica TaxID=3369 RepID=UPI002414CE4A|nr:uncharacterized protein LOC131052869 [Cryptomeria japonica]GLJ31751.1 hypothetical protein SUGI_0638650 [Cryptomeria japonica]
MGNCLKSSVDRERGDQMIRVMKMDGKMLEYSPPLLVRDLLTAKDYGRNYMLAHPQNVRDALPQDYKLKGGELYYLIPSHLEDESSFNGGGMKERGVKGEKGMKIKIMVSKTELKALLSDGCVKEKWVEDFLLKQLEAKFLQLQQKACVARGKWRPALEKIPETN